MDSPARESWGSTRHGRFAKTKAARNDFPTVWSTAPNRTSDQTCFRQVTKADVLQSCRARRGQGCHSDRY